MRRLLTFLCEGATLGGTLDGAAGVTGVLVVTGGTQTRIGSHRLFERLGAALGEAGYPAFRFDRRGVGDSEGEDPDYTGNLSDIDAALVTFRKQSDVKRVVGFGLCDGATSLALFGANVGLDALILANPWFVEAAAGEPPPAAIRHHYRQRLLSLSGWKKLLSGDVAYKKLLSGVVKLLKPRRPASLAGKVAAGLASRSLPITLLLAADDATAIAARDVWNSADFASVRGGLVEIARIATDAHTFSRPGDFDALLGLCLDALRRLDA